MPDNSLANLAPGVEIVVGRQPIFDRSRRIVGYELLFRRLLSATHENEELTSDLMTAEVLMNSLRMGIDTILDDRLAFVNADRGLITSSTLPLLPPERCVLELHESVVPDDEVIAGCARLSAAGYMLALDNFTWFDGAERLLEMASIVKIDVHQLGPEKIVDLMARCADYRIERLAEKVETAEQLDACVELGFEYFQGYVLSRPEIVWGRGLSPTQLSRLELVAKIFDAEIDLDGVERVVMTDPALVHQLLELAGIGASHGTKREVRTVREAAVLTGSARLRSWAGLLALLGRTGDGDSDDERMTTALVRSQMCELLAANSGAEYAAFAGTAAMVSAFDLLLGLPLEEVLDSLSLSPELRSAAQRDNSPAGDLLADVIDYQFNVEPPGARTGIDEAALQSAWVRAVSFAQHVTSAVAVAS